MNKEELQNKISETQNAIKELHFKLEKLQNEIKKINKTGYERNNQNERYYCPYSDGNIAEYIENNSNYDQTNWDNANYYNDKNFAEMQARADTLWRNIRRWQALNDEAVDIHDQEVTKYYIRYDIYRKDFIVDNCRGMISNAVFFESAEKCLECIMTFRNELLWYFISYKPRMDMEE